MVKKLLPLIPEHHIYVEPFGGGGSLLFAKNPSPVEVYNDLHSDVVNLFRVLRDPEQFETFLKLSILTPYSREEYYHARETFKEEEDNVQRAYKWFVMARQSFAGRINCGWGYTVSRSCREMAEAVSTWLSCIDMLPDIHKRLSRVQIENNDWRKILDTYDTPETFFYLDPPYVTATRKSGGYDHEMTDEDHKELVQALLNLKGKALLSGYPSPIYDPLTKAGWTRKEWQTACHAAGRTKGTGIQGDGSALRQQPRTEAVWMNYVVDATRHKQNEMFSMDQPSCQGAETQ